jgi:hypothetical protein
MPLPKLEDAEYTLPEPEDTKPVQGELDIEIEDDTPPEDRNKPSVEIDDPDDEELSTYSKTVQSRIHKMTLAKNSERRAKEDALRQREAAETFAKQVYEENKRLKSQLEEGSKIFIDQNKSTAQMEIDNAKKRFKQAFEVGDSDELAAAQEALAKATLRLDKAETMRPIESPDIPYEEPKQNRLAPTTQQWVDKNSDWWGQDEEMTMAAMGLDKKLQKQYGSEYVGTPEYFKTIDKTMRKRFPEHFGVQEEENEPPPEKNSQTDSEDNSRRTKPASVVAPATRSTPPNRVKLKASEATIARRLGVPIEEYAKQVALLRRGNE